MNRPSPVLRRHASTPFTAGVRRVRACVVVTVTAIFIVLSTSDAPAAGQDGETLSSRRPIDLDTLRQLREEAKRRERKLIVNNDGSDYPAVDGPITPETFLASRVAGVAKTRLHAPKQ